MPAGLMNKWGSAAALGDSIIKGFLRGHAVREERNNAKAQATITAADKATQDAYQRYQDTLASSKSPEDQKAAYEQYLTSFNQAKAVKQQFAIPEDKKKGGQKKTGDKKKDGQQPMTFGAQLKDFFEANPHIVPQIALMTMQPEPPGPSRQTRVEQMQEKALAADVNAADTQAKEAKFRMEQEQQTAARQDAQRKVEAAGGVDAVLADKKASPEMQQTAREMKFSALDTMDPIGKMKLQGFQQVQSGESKDWSPQQRMLMGALGVVPQPVEVRRTGKNGHEESILVDPTTNQPIPGSKPLDLGPPAWAQEFYAKQGMLHAELKRAVESDPTQYGVRITGNAAADKAAVDARVAQLQVNADFGIKTLSDTLGSTAYDIARDNELLAEVVKGSGLNAKEGTSPLDRGTYTMSYGDGKDFAVGRDYFAKILNEFTVESNGVRAFRNDAPTPGVRSAQNPDGHPAEVLDAERKFLYGVLKNQLMSQKGKKALTSEQADQLLSRTSLGNPITAPKQRTLAPPPQGDGRTPAQKQAGIQPPPGPTKIYFVPGREGAYQLTDEEVAKLRANNIQLTEASPELLNQLGQQ